MGVRNNECKTKYLLVLDIFSCSLEIAIFLFISKTSQIQHSCHVRVFSLVFSFYITLLNISKIFTFSLLQFVKKMFNKQDESCLFALKINCCIFNISGTYVNKNNV